MSHHQPAEIDSHELERTIRMWHNFTQLIKWSIVGVATLLILMALVFIR